MTYVNSLISIFKFIFIFIHNISDTIAETADEFIIEGVSIDSEALTFERIKHHINKSAICCLVASNAFWIGRIHSQAYINLNCET